MADIKCSDYVIFKIVYQNEADDFSHAVYTKYWDFILALAEKLTGKNKNAWYWAYGMNVNDCIKDELQENFGIFFLNGEGTSTLMIPNGMTDAIDWIKANCDTPYRIVSKTNLVHQNLFRQRIDLSHNRRIAKEFMDKFRADNNL